MSVLLGLGFTFFSGAVEAWLVDALTATGYTGSLQVIFGRGLVVTGIAGFSGSVLGGVIAQVSNLGVAFLLRAGVATPPHPSPSKQRATVLSFDSLLGSLGGVFIQPALDRAADLHGYGTSLVIGAVVELVGLPFVLASRRQRDPADTNTVQADAAAPAA